MNQEELIPLFQLCDHYDLEPTFFDELHEVGLIELLYIDRTRCMHMDSLTHFERIIRIHDELRINPEGIDVVLNLLDQMDEMKRELRTVQNRLSIYESLF